MTQDGLKMYMHVANIRIDRNGTTATAQAYIRKDTPVTVMWRTKADGPATTTMTYEEVEHLARQQRTRTVNDHEVNQQEKSP